MENSDGTCSPKYGCRQCGSVELWGKYDTLQVFRAEGDALIDFGSKRLDSGLRELFCYECDSEIVVESLKEVKIVY